MNHRMNFNSAMFMWILYVYYDLSCMLGHCTMVNLHKGEQCQSEGKRLDHCQPACVRSSRIQLYHQIHLR